MSLRASIGFQIPTNVVEVGNEITSDALAAINSASTPSAANPFATLSVLPAAGVTADKAFANAIAASMWYNYDTGSDWNRNTGITNSYILGGSVSSCGITDGTTFVTGFPSVVSSLASNADWKVSINGTLSDFSIMYQIV
jgi:hypothetical protein